MKNYLSSVYESLTETAEQLLGELEKISEARKAMENILFPKSKKSTGVRQDQSGKSTLMQSPSTKAKIVEFIANNNGASVAQIQKNVKKPNGRSYAVNSIRTYLSELSKVNKIQRVKGKRIYESMS